MSCPKPNPAFRHGFEVADLFRIHGTAYREKHRITSGQRRIMRDIEYCRTGKFGGHKRKCKSCGHTEISYNSCRNRHCPKCQALNKARWLEARKQDLLPVGYFHNVFTLPHELNPLVLRNKSVLLELLFRGVKETLEEFAGDSRHLGGKLGFTSVLHTWDQQLNAHFHLHVVIPAGALSFDKTRWIKVVGRKQNKKPYLFPVRALSKKFQGKFLSLLKQLYLEKRLEFSGKCEALGGRREFQALLDGLYRKNWVVYSKEPFKGPEQVFDYLGRYTHRVAISNNRIIRVDKKEVGFTWKNRNKGYQREVCTLSGERFISRFLLHELPSGFMRIRHYGFLSSKRKKGDLKIIRGLLGTRQTTGKLPSKTTEELLLALTGIDIRLCPKCGKKSMQMVEEFYGPFGRPPSNLRKFAFMDSS